MAFFMVKSIRKFNLYFKSMSSYNWRGSVFFLGEYHQAKNIPWNYTMTTYLR